MISGGWDARKGLRPVNQCMGGQGHHLCPPHPSATKPNQVWGRRVGCEKAFAQRALLGALPVEGTRKAGTRLKWRAVPSSTRKRPASLGE